MNTERGSALLIVIGLVLILILVGFFRGQGSFLNSFGYKSLLNLPCGISVQRPSSGARISFPLSVDGYVNGCGWNIEGSVAGSAQVFDSTGLPVTKPVALSVSGSAANTPEHFEVRLVPVSAPHSDSGNIIFTSTTGLVYAVSIKF